jgi:hypothetical protein
VYWARIALGISQPDIITVTFQAAEALARSFYAVTIGMRRSISA